MSLNVIKYAMPSGIPGAISRVGGGVVLDVEAVIMDPESPLTQYGLAGQIDAATGLFRLMEAADADIYGFLSRPYPIQPYNASGFSGAIPLGTSATPPATGTVAALRAGYMTVTLRNATAAVKNGTVYVRVDNATADLPLGGVEAADDGANTIATKWIFTGPADADGNVEISNIGNNK